MPPASSSQLFSGGNETANLMLSTGVLEKGWRCVHQLEQPFAVYEYQNPKFTIVAFNSSAAPSLEPSLEKLDGSSPLGFLITKDNPAISIHSRSLSAFRDLLKVDGLVNQLKKDQTRTQLILVGRALGGSLAALFALWLLEKRDEAEKGKKTQIITPICITYGSPFIGDAGLQKAVSNVKKLKAHFWHVVSRDDAVAHAFVLPRLASRVVPGASAEFKPFGTYFLCSQSGCTCIDHPESVLDVLQSSTHNLEETQLHRKVYDYGLVLQQLKEKKIRHRSNGEPQGNSTLQIGLALQLQALGFAHSDQNAAELLKEMKDREKFEDIKRKGAQNPSKKLNDAKKQMALLEWYKKRCEDGEMDYYDCFKERSAERDYDVINFRNILNRYWKDEVEEAENNPQSIDGPLRDRWLFSSATYRRMVEPLDIADYYRKPRNRNYIQNKRAPHYVKLEGWYEEAMKLKKKRPEEETKKAAILTMNSCFWAYVEEAVRTLEELKRMPKGDKGRDDLWKKLKEFEDRVWNWITNYELSTTVFFERSTFMKWWQQYESELEHKSNFTSYMKAGKYHAYIENSTKIC